jgi:hypothetical protein
MKTISQIIQDLIARRDAINTAIDALQEIQGMVNVSPATPAVEGTPVQVHRPKFTMSEAAKERLRRSTTRRWRQAKAAGRKSL